ncbi:MAG: GDP/UDP-N,N'-diacetylbacillosamine 2-epimerase (hydrolyzing) [Parvicella sp.]|jgi:GDP/UDP-N,N'-diacetylbacillosamine 2-epimerase (hydrolysing)
MKRIGVLTSSRADYGIYLPLLRKIESSQDFKLSMIVFGTHLSPFHGMSADLIRVDGFSIDYQINSMLLHDDENAIATASSLTMLKFSDFWQNHADDFDLVFCLGDRYEMFGAVYAGIPYGIKFAHIHGGETTAGAIDNIYRHAISQASSLHFTSTENYKEKVNQITDSKDIFVTGALSLDNLRNVKLYSLLEMKNNFGIDFSESTILITVHPETVASERNVNFAHICYEVFYQLAEKYQLVITMPNADTLGSVFRNEFIKLKNDVKKNIILVENFGTQGYFSAMHYSKFLIGNTSSGIIEAASFRKYVINLGDRQLGRLSGDNVKHSPFNVKSILENVAIIESKGEFTGDNPYDLKGASEKICQILADYFIKLNSSLKN